MLINTPVLIVGAGPTGLSASIALARHGVRSLVVERHAGTSIDPKATAVSVRTMELFRAWGIDHAVRCVGRHPRPGAPVLHTLAAPELGRQPPVPADSAPGVSPVEAGICAQDHLESILLDHARGYLGIDLRFGTELVSFEQDADGVSASIVDRTSGERAMVRARYLVAADGASSPIRTSLGIRMIGAEHVSRYITAVGMRDIGVDALGPQVFEIFAQVADRFRDGRVLLSGDAAHRMTPSGVLGLNSAIHDAHNLAWKIAAVEHGWAEASLLETYEAERRPVAERNAARSLGLRRDLDMASLDLGAAYISSAVARDELALTTVMRDVTAAAWPGCRAPHEWLESEHGMVSTLDLWKERFVLLSGAGTAGDVWAACAWSAARELGVPFVAYTIGPDGNLQDRAASWHVAYGIEPGGAVLIRPDGHIGWRARRAVSNPIGAIANALSCMLGRKPETVVAWPPPWVPTRGITGKPVKIRRGPATVSEGVASNNHSAFSRGR